MRGATGRREIPTRSATAAHLNAVRNHLGAHFRQVRVPRYGIGQVRAAVGLTARGKHGASIALHRRPTQPADAHQLQAAIRLDLLHYGAQRVDMRGQRARRIGLFAFDDAPLPDDLLRAFEGDDD